NANNEFSFVQALAIQPDQKIVAGGLAHNSFGVPEFALARYMPDGSLDPNFGVGGKVRTGISGGSDEVEALVIQPDGKIVAVGTANQVFALARYNTDGSLDNSFGSAGKLTTEFFESNDAAQAVALQPDGKIVVAGRVLTSTGRQRFALARYNSNGTLDNSFGSAGKLVEFFHNELFDARAFAILLQSDSKIIAGGWASGPQGGTDFALARYNPDGTLDNTFGTAGKVTTDFLNRGNEQINHLAVQPDGKIIATGFSDLRGSDDRFALVRYNQDGSVDNSFGVEGKVTSTFFPDFDCSIEEIELQPDGKIVAVGWALFTGGNHFALARYTSDQLATPTPTPSPTPTPGPTPSPAPLELLMDDSGPSPTHVAALESSISLRDPFSVFNQKSPLTPAIDPNTRLTIFVRNLQLPQPASSVIVRIFNEFLSRDVPASDVRAVPNTDLVQVTFRLPDDLQDHNWNISVKAQGQETQSRVIRIRTF
ncbi:MAG TPA: delta-60 repeat domain-containing protein, partial [Pyrinomonadaceae bacterium]|nr:delta-60 repeat domain-containing protein [Pyrinomonadaceae bacterium]